MDLNLKKDLSTLTTVEEKVFNKLIQKIEWCINDSIESAIINNEDVVNVDVGIGNLIIKIDDTIKYRFMPSKQFEKSLLNTITNERNDLKLNLENSLVSKLQNVYKSFF